MIDLIDFGRIGFAINISLRLAFERASPWGEVASQSDDGAGIERADVLGNKLYAIDSNRPMRQSHNNPDVQELYKDFLEKPLSEKAEQLLHSDHVKEHNYM